MHQICIAKKVSRGNVEFLDFALDENDNLILFETFKDASSFLKSKVTGDELLNFIITTTEAQANNPRLQEILSKETTKAEPPQGNSKKEEVEFLFVLECEEFEIENNTIIVDKKGNRKLAPVIMFVDVRDPSTPVHLSHYSLKNLMVDRASN
jgi:hypothetical protein